MGIEAALIGGGLGLLGSSLAADSAQDTASAQANAQLQAARIAADAASFRPVGVTTRFGSSGFRYDDKGNLVGSGYQVAPDLAGMREGFINAAGNTINQFTSAIGNQQQYNQGAQGLINLGKQYIATDPNAAAQQYMNQQRALYAPGDEQKLAGIRNNLYQTGRMGLATGATTAGNMAATNPEMAAYYNSLAQRDAQLAANAQAQAQNDVKFGAGLMGTAGALQNTGYQNQVSALAPYQAALGAASDIESKGQNALTLGTNMGSAQTASNNAAANALLSGGTNAANSLAAGSASAGNIWGGLFSGLANNRQFTSGVGNWMRGTTAASNPLGLGQINPVNGEYMASLGF